ncbi:MAG TPA: UDP-N-acetylmuramoyl-tripeptide--D-alanyl-D-alanine ligase [Vicinamibacterales bacterium]|nr:UDP-N-acetylmuramoyl-tripeptide--D-alanyl-D-alanine ligase [Vicinamibacterales bacterium]
MEPIALTAGEIAAVVRGEVAGGDRARRIERYSIDSRTVAPGEMFIAIRGERFDGHWFVADALARGAAGAIVQEAAAGVAAASTGPVLIRVTDTIGALQDLGREIRRRSGARVAAITGSAGKTTTKETAAEFLAARYRVFRNKGNLNNHIGLPISLLELRTRPDVAVVELGMNHPGEIRTLVGIAEPEVRVWTNVGDAHLGFFDSPDAIADAKAEILEQAQATDVLVANADDPRVMLRARAFAGRLVSFGTREDADVRAVDVELRGLDGSAARLRTPGGEAALHVPLLGLGNLSNVLAAAATALEFGVPLQEIAERARGLRPAVHRGELIRLPGGVTLVDDSYNSSPSALTRALEVIAAAGGCARKVAVLGEMLELGAHAERLHLECGRAAASAGLDVLVTVGGPPASALARAAVAGGMPSASVVHVATSEDAARLAVTRVRPGDLVLVKGSRGIGTDLVVERLRAEFA